MFPISYFNIPCKLLFGSFYFNGRSYQPSFRRTVSLVGCKLQILILTVFAYSPFITFSTDVPTGYFLQITLGQIFKIVFGNRGFHFFRFSILIVLILYERECTVLGISILFIQYLIHFTFCILIQIGSIIPFSMNNSIIFFCELQIRNIVILGVYRLETIRNLCRRVQIRSQVSFGQPVRYVIIRHGISREVFVLLHILAHRIVVGIGKRVNNLGNISRTPTFIVTREVVLVVIAARHQESGRTQTVYKLFIHNRSS